MNSLIYGLGTLEDPILISAPNQLNSVRYNLGAYYRLMADINLSNYESFNPTDLSFYKNFDPIGSEKTPFSGIFDGNGHTINDLIINNDSNNVGLFRVNIGEIKNVRFENTNVTGDSNVGILVGVNLGKISKSYATGNVIGKNIIGGLVGLNNGQISDSHAKGNVEGTFGVGGLIGYKFSGDVNDSHSHVNVKGYGYIGKLIGLDKKDISYPKKDE